MDRKELTGGTTAGCSMIMIILSDDHGSYSRTVFYSQGRKHPKMKFIGSGHPILGFLQKAVLTKKRNAYF